MTPEEIEMSLEWIRGQGYPLCITESQAQVLVGCIQRIMEHVPEDDHVLIRADYAGVTSALFHPRPGIGHDA